MKRGELLRAIKYEQTVKFEQQIIQYVDEHYQELIRPVAAFVIFETQECQERCFTYLMTSSNFYGKINYSEKALEILQEKLELEEAPEPSDIIWENMALS